MERILAFTTGVEDWKAGLVSTDRQWRKGYSARTLAHCWEAADGFPPEVATVFADAADPLLEDVKPLLALPEYKVPLPGGQRPSQNDLFVLARSGSKPISIMVEGKVDESFGPLLGDWRREASVGKTNRLRFLQRTLGLQKSPSDAIRYQLMHRTVSALIEAERFRAQAAVLLVHSFSRKRSGWSDYAAFLALFGQDAVFGRLQPVPASTKIALFAAWVPGNPAFLEA